MLTLLAVATLLFAASAQTISNADELKNMANSADMFELTDNITLPENWVPITSFTGVLDGKYFTIFMGSLTVGQRMGLFDSIIDVYIRNLNIEVTGPLIGNGTYDNTYPDDYIAIGVVAGQALSCTIDRVTVSGDIVVNLTQSMKADKGSSSLAAFVGGLFGHVDTISRLRGASSITCIHEDGVCNLGGLIGRISSGQNSCDNLQYSNETATIKCEALVCVVGGVVSSVTESTIRNSGVYIGNIIANSVKVGDNVSTKVLTMAGGFAGQILGRTFQADFGIRSVVINVIVKALSITSTNVAGGFAANFAGTDAMDMEIAVDKLQSGGTAGGFAAAAIEASSMQHISVSLGTIELSISDDKTYRNTGGFVGVLKNTSQIRDCFVSAQVIHGVIVTGGVGGFVGFADEGNIFTSFAYVTMLEIENKQKATIGGFSGRLEYNKGSRGYASISSCAAIVTHLSMIIYADDNLYVGGFAAQLLGEAGNSQAIILTNCYFSGRIRVTAAVGSVTKAYVGGFVGGIRYDGAITGCLAAGKIDMMADLAPVRIGRFSGATTGDAYISNSIAYMDVTSGTGIPYVLKAGFYGSQTRVDRDKCKANYLVVEDPTNCEEADASSPSFLRCISEAQLKDYTAFPDFTLGSSQLWTMAVDDFIRPTGVPTATNLKFDYDTLPRFTLVDCLGDSCYDYVNSWQYSAEQGVVPTPKGISSCVSTCDRSSYISAYNCTCVEGCPDLEQGQCIGFEHSLCDDGYANMMDYMCRYYTCSTDTKNPCSRSTTNATCILALDMCACPDSRDYYDTEQKTCVRGCDAGVHSGVCQFTGTAVCNDGYAPDYYDGTAVELCATRTCYNDDMSNRCGDVGCDPLNGDCLCEESTMYYDDSDSSCKIGCIGLYAGICVGKNRAVCSEGYYTDPSDDYLCMRYDCRNVTTQQPCNGMGTCDQATGTCTCNTTSEMGGAVVNFLGNCAEKAFVCPDNVSTVVDGKCSCLPGYYTPTPARGECWANDCRDNTYLTVSTEDELREMMHCPNKNYVLNNDIVLTKPWEGISIFSGSLDGQGYTISGVNLTLTEGAPNRMIGFAKQISGGSISNVSFIINANISSTEVRFFGGVAASVESGTFYGIYVKGNLTLDILMAASPVFFGCFAGVSRSISMTIAECNMTCTGITGTCMMGGHSATLRKSTSLGQLIRSYSNLTCFASSESTAEYTFGCVIGGLFSQMYSPLYAAYFAGSIAVLNSTGLSTAAGICAICQGNLNRVYSNIASFTMIGDRGLFAGGLASNINDATVTDCFAIVNVLNLTAKFTVIAGGFIAESLSGGLSVVNCYSQLSDVTIMSDVAFKDDVYGAIFGGFMGNIFDEFDSVSTFSQSYSYLGVANINFTDTSTATAPAYAFLGGFFGNFTAKHRIGRVTSCFSLIDTISIDALQTMHFGGFVGHIMINSNGAGTLRSCWSHINTLDALLSKASVATKGFGGFVGRTTGFTEVADSVCRVASFRVMLRNDNAAEPNVPAADGQSIGLFQGASSGAGRAMVRSVVDVTLHADNTNILPAFYSKGDHSANYVECSKARITTSGKGFTCVNGEAFTMRANFPALNFNTYWATPGDEIQGQISLRLLPAYIADDFMPSWAMFSTKDVRPSNDSNNPVSPWDYENVWAPIAMSPPMFWFQNGNCSAIDTNCLECDLGRCTQCDTDGGYTLDKNQFRCTRIDCSTITDCTACGMNNGELLCRECANDKKPSSTGVTCVSRDCKSADVNCNSCTWVDDDPANLRVVCNGCAANYVWVPSRSACVKNTACKDGGSSNVPNCAVCDTADPSNCQSCLTDYTYDSGKRSCIANCVVSGSSAYIANCASCSTTTPTNCLQCLSGFTLEASNKKCTESCLATSGTSYIQFCAACSQTYHDRCETCDSTHFLSNGKCLAICLSPYEGVGNCASCDDVKPTTCTSCRAGYFLDNSVANGQCQPGCTWVATDNSYFVKNCISCVTDAPLACSQCQVGYDLSVDGRGCLGYCMSFGDGHNFVENCAECQESDTNKCGKCNDGYTLSKDGLSCKLGKSSGGSTSAVVALAVILAIVIVAAAVVIFLMFRGVIPVSRFRKIHPISGQNSSVQDSDGRLSAF